MSILLTRGRIISEGLSQATRTDLAINARLWLNLFLDKIYQVQDWAWLTKNAGIVSLVEGGNVPSDYRAMKVATLWYNGQIQREITSAILDEYQALRRIGVASGQPRRVFINKTLGTFNFWPTPDFAYQWEYYYYYLPTLPDDTDPGTDSQYPVWGLHSDLLVKAIELKAMFYNDDTRYQQAEKDLMEEIIMGRMNDKDTRAGSNKLKLGKSYRRRF